LKPLNKLLCKYPFKMETTRSIMSALHQGDWTIYVDLRDAYFHIPIHRTSQKYLRFTHGKRVFQFVALPFGLAPAPFVFTKIMATVARVAHKRMMHLFLYLDDSLMRNACRAELIAQIPVLLHVFNILGFIRNDEKSELTPKQCFSFLGVWYDLILAIAKVPQERWEKMSRAIYGHLAAPTSPARVWCVVLGLLTSAQDLVVLGRLHIRRLQIHMNSNWVPRLDMAVQIPMSEECRVQLRWWLPGHRSVHPTLHSEGSHFHGCVYHRLGCSCGGRSSIRILDTGRASSPQQQLRAFSSDQSSGTFN
jgi:hypothetical protein